MRDSKTIDIKDVPIDKLDITIYSNQELQIGCCLGTLDSFLSSTYVYICATSEQLRLISEKCLELADILERKNQENQVKEASAA